MRILYLDVDTLRPDHLGCYGYLRDTSPNIDRIAADGLRFEQCHASDTPCLPSRAAMFTGRFGIHNGVVNHGGTAADLRLEGMMRGFKQQRPQLPDLLRGLGLWTASISPFGERHSAMWFYKGFNEVINTGKSGNERADEVAPAALDWIERNAGRDDWFLHVNLWDPHCHYRTPGEYGEPFKDAPGDDWLCQELLDAFRRSYGVRSAIDPTDFRFMGRDLADLPQRMPAQIETVADFRRWIDGYDTGIRYADDHIGQLLSSLERQGVLDDLVIILTSDHGENQGELNIFGDHHTTDGVTPHIPMIVRAPGILPAGVADGLFYQFDVGASLLRLLGAELSSEWDARDFSGQLAVGQGGRDSLVLSHCAWSAQRSARFGDYIFIRTYHPGLKDLPDYLLFDLRADPHETRDLADARPDLVGRGLEILERWHTEQMTVAESDVDPLWTVMREGGPYHTRWKLESYCAFLEKLGGEHRAHADNLRRRCGHLERMP